MQRAELKKTIREHNLAMIGVTYVDLAGVTRVKPAAAEEIDSVLENGIKTSRANFALTSTDNLVRGTSMNISQGDLAMVPDPETFVMPSYTPGVGRFVGDLFEKDGQPSPLCPRIFYKRVLSRSEKMGFHFEVGFEGEFHLLAREPGEPRQLDRFRTHTLEGFDTYQKFILDAIAALKSVNLKPTKAHIEGGKSQLEFDIDHGPGLAAADGIVCFKDAIRSIARQEGLLASFMPKIGNDWWGSGMHMHMSLWSVGKATSKNLFDGQGELGLSDLALSFIAGVVEHLPALSAVAAPSVNSYKRILPGKWNADAAVYGAGARGAAVRVPDERGKAARIECRFPDGSCNPYLALGTILTCGLDGIARKARPDPPLEIDLSFMTDREIRKRGMQLMPRSLSEALRALEQDDLLAEAMGPALFEEFIKNRENDVADAADKVTHWETDTFLDLY